MHTRIVVVAAALVAALALAQTQTLMMGADTTTLPDGGILRRVQVDPSGRLVVTGAGGGSSGTATSTDAGVSVTVPVCTRSRSSASSVGTSVVAMPADGGLAGRWMVRLCNSAKNSGTPIVTCSVLTVPDAGTLSDGEALEVGDCATWTTGEQVYCLSDTASTVVSSWECR